MRALGAALQEVRSAHARTGGAGHRRRWSRRPLTVAVLAATTMVVALTGPASIVAPAPAGAAGATCGLCILAPSGTTLSATGNATVGVSGAAVDVDSSDASAITATGNAVVSAPAVGVVGGARTTGHATIANLSTGIAPVPDPLAGAVAPVEPVPSPVPSVHVTGHASQTITPGVYQDIQVTGGASLTLQAGIYVVLGQLSSSGQSQVSGSGVMIYLACASYPTPCTAGQRGGSVSLTGGGQLTLSGGPSEGCTPLTIFADAKNATTITLTGGASDTFGDDIYAPSAALAVTGNGVLAISGSVITGTASLTGNAGVAITPTGLPGCSGAAPTVTGVIPDNGVTSGGNTVEVTGTNFAGTTEVDFGGTKITTGISVSQTGTSLTVEAPPGAVGTVDVRVTTPAGESPVTPADQYTYTTPPTTAYSGLSLTLAPTVAGPDTPFTTQTLDATLLSSAGHALAGMEVQFTVTGPNATVGDAATDAAGVAAFTYTGDSTGTDTVTATFAAGPDSVTSNTSTVTWVAPTAPVAPVSVSPLQGNFYAEGLGATTFVATPASTPAFAETFPDIAFNPPAGDIPDDRSGVGPNTHPFTDVTTDVTGAATGTQPAEAGSERAGVGDLQAFDAVFTATITVATGGDASFSIQAADGFELGIGNGASRVSGDFVNPPASLQSAFDAYPLVAVYDQPSGNAVLTHPFTVAFPTAGTYPIEIDYFSVGSPQLSLVFSPSAAVPAQPNTPPLNVYVGYEDTLRAANDFTVTPLPWFGSPGVTFEGDGSARGPGADSGGIRFDNVTNAPVTLQKVTVDVPNPGGATSTHYDQWPANIVIPPGQTAILAENAGFASFDTSDVDTANQCGVVKTLVPRINVTLGGTTTTYLDTGEVLNTGGFDLACIGNESQPWVRVGTTGPAVPVTPPTREGAVGGWDTATSSFLLFGGLSEPSNQYLGDTWDWVNGTWTLAAPTTSPAPRFGAAGAYDASSGNFVLFGGYDASSGVNYDDTWTWDGTNWTQQHPATSPPVLNQGSDRMAYDAATGQIVLVTSDVRGSTSPDTWTWDGTNWTEHAGVPQPGPLWQPALSYDPDTRSVILFGGAAGYGGTDSAATWSWDGTSWTQLSPATSPPARSEATMDYDPVLHGLVLFSGTQHGNSGLDDTWLYSGGNWQQLQPLAVAPARAEAVSAYDPVADKEMVGFGVQNGASLGSTSLGDLWFLDTTRWGTNPAPTPPIPPSSSLILSPSQPLSLSVGTPQTFTVSATSGNGQPIAGLALDIAVTGANPQTLTATTSNAGTATVSYDGPAAGVDQIQATGFVSGIEEGSNVETATWTTPPVTIADPQPADGSEIKTPTPVDATLTPPAGQTITAWSVVVQSTQPGSTPITLASGSGTPPSPLATLDPTTLDDGTYTVTISGTSSGGGTQTVTSSVEVSGTVKFGGFTAEWHELSIPVDGLAMTVNRDYDSFARSGDFGPGWHVDISNFQVGSGRALGAGGWQEFPTSCSFLGCNYAFAAQNVTHDVTVTWPDGHAETWSFTPTGASFGGLQVVEPGYTPVPGTNTRDTLASGGSLVFGADGNLYNSVIFQVSTGTIFDPTEFTLTTSDGSQYVLSTTSGLVSETDPSGNSITIDANGIHGSNGQSITFVRDPSHGGRITEITGPDDGVNGENQHWIYNYDAAGELSSVTDPVTTTNYSYNSAGLLTGSTAADGTTLLAVTYSPDGRVSTVANGPNPPMLTSSDPAAMTQTVVDPARQLTTTDHFDAAGDMTEMDQTFGGTTLKTLYSYDSSGRLTQTIDPLGHATSTVYDETPGSPTQGDILSETDANGNTTTYTAYSDTGQPGETINPNGSVAQVATFDPATGYVASLDVPGLAPTTYTYGPSGQISTLTEPGGGSFAFTYDANGNQTSVTDGAGDTVHTTANVSGQVVQEVSPTGSTIDYSYDGNGNITSETEVGTGATTSEVLNGFDEPVSSTDANGKTTTYTYDGAGNVLTRTDAAGVTTTYGYDADGRLTSEVSPSGTTHFAYDALGRIVEADNGTQQLDLAYDADGNLLTQVSCAPQPAGQTCPSGSPVVTQTFDALGDITSTATSAGATSYTYNSDEGLASVTDPAGRTFVYGYDPQGRQVGLSRPNGTNDGWTFNDAGVPTGLTTTAPDGTVLAQATNTIDPSTGQITQMADLAGANDYTYFHDGTLASATHPAATGLTAESYTYDGAGNRVTGPTPANVSTYNAADELQGNATATYTWNVDGDLASKTVTATGVRTTFSWNADSQLLGLADTAGDSVTNAYDPFGRLVSETSNGKTTTYTWDGQTLLSETTGGVTTSMVTNPAPGDTIYGIPSGAPADTLETVTGSTVGYPVTDMHGDWIAATGANGQLTQQLVDYSAFGTPSRASSLAAGFDGYLPVAGGLDYASGRFYDPGTGLFLSQDPDPALNPYAYTGNSPVTYFDPTGRESAAEEGELDSEAAYLAKAGEEKVSVYIARDAEGACYVGITNKFGRRVLQHDGRFVVITEIKADLTRDGARIVEQTVIRELGLGGKIGQTGKLLNKINSIAEGGPLWNLAAAENSPFLDIAALLDNFSACP